MAAGFRGSAFLAAGCLAAAFLAGCFTAAFLPAGLAAGFLAGGLATFLATGFLAAVLAGVFRTGALPAAGFLAAGFFAPAFAGVLRAAAFFPGAGRAAVFLPPAFLPASGFFLAVFFTTAFLPAPFLAIPLLAGAFADARPPAREALAAPELVADVLARRPAGDAAARFPALVPRFPAFAAIRTSRVPLGRPRDFKPIATRWARLYGFTPVQTRAREYLYREPNPGPAQGHGKHRAKWHIDPATMAQRLDPGRVGPGCAGAKL